MKNKRNTYIGGALIASLGMIVSKALGIIYVIPFYNIIGTTGGALYGYAYNIYSIFLGISTAGLPFAISKMISEFDTLGNHRAKEKTFKIAKYILGILGLLSFFTMFLFTEQIAYLIIGNVKGGNTIEDIVFAIRVISFSVLIVPILSIYRGYLQGHRIITVTSVSQVLEQLLRVSIILFACFFLKNVLSITNIVMVSLAAATIGSVFSWLYLVGKVSRKRKENNELVTEKDQEDISYKSLLNRIIMHALPFVFGDVCKSLYNSIDTFFVVKTLTNSLGYLVSDAETVISVITLWGNKLNSIVLALATGFATSLIPHLTRSYVKKDYAGISDKINKTFQILIYATLPLAAGLSFLSGEVWHVLYGSNVLGAKVFSVSIFGAFSTVLLTTCTVTLLTLREYKTMYKALIAGLIFNAVFDVPFMHLFHLIDKAYIGASVATICGNFVSILMVVRFLHKEYKIDFKKTFNMSVRIVIANIIMVMVLYGFSKVIPQVFISHMRINSAINIVIYAVIGSVIYYLYTKKIGLYKEITKNVKLKDLLRGVTE